MFKWKRKQLTKEEYLMKLSLEEREQLRFKGYVFEVTMVSGEVHVLRTYYIRGKNNEYQQLTVLNDYRDVCYTDKGVEVSVKHIESSKMLEEKEEFYIGENAWKEISWVLMGDRVSNVGLVIENYMLKLLTMD